MTGGSDPRPAASPLAPPADAAGAPGAPPPGDAAGAPATSGPGDAGGASATPPPGDAASAPATSGPVDAAGAPATSGPGDAAGAPATPPPADAAGAPATPPPAADAGSPPATPPPTADAGRSSAAHAGLAPDVAALLSPDRAAAEGAAFGQLAAALPGGGLLITASRLVEFGARAAILLAPGLFRLDLTPQEETLGLYPRPLGPYEVDWRAAEETWDGYRDPKGPGPMELAGRFEVPGQALVAWIHILSFTERDALATHFVAKCEIRPERG